MADRRLQVFHAVAKHGSFTRAAEHLHMTQPAVTFQIKQLEEHFDTRLLDRGHGKISLTDAGELVLAYAERILGLSAELDLRVSEMTDELAGQIKIGASTTIAAYWLPAALQSFKQRYPRVLPRVVVGNSKLIENSVVARDLDIGLIELVSAHNNLERRNVARDELKVICAPDHPLARSTALRAKDLIAHPFIDRDPGNGIRLIADEFFEAAGIAGSEIHLCAEVGSLSAIKELAAAGLGFAIASERAIGRDLAAGRLSAVRLEPRLYTPLEIILPRDKFRSRVVATFAEHIAETFAALMTEQGSEA
ncbi:MAG: LysR family transcriptional regulator [Thauera sp.]|nr:LysR family transcriptional regulator [Thauera sp.]